MKIRLTLFYIGLIYFFYSCTTCSVKSVPCDAFNEPSFFNWFPYKENDVLRFRNTATADTFSYVILQADISGAYEAKRGGFNNSTHGCNSWAEISTVNNGNPNEYFNIYYSVTKEFDNGPVNKSLSIYFKGAYWPAGEITETTITSSIGYSTDSATASVSSNMFFDNGITYPYVVSLLKDTAMNKTERVYKLFIAKNNGIIGFEMFPSKQKWVIQ